MNIIENYLFLLKEKDLYTYNHSKRVAYYSFLIGRILNYSEEELCKLTTSALLHDIGKIYIPDDILLKTGPLTNDEYQTIKKHSIYSKILLENNFPDIVDDVVMHHERLDGSGYPYHTKNLSLNCKIIGIVDSFDAMTSNRGYNKKKTVEEAFSDLFNKQYLYDINIIKVFYDIFHETKEKKYIKY